MALPSGSSKRGNLPTGDLEAAAKSVEISTSTPLYSAAMRVAKARKDASGVCNLYVAIVMVVVLQSLLRSK